VSFYRRIAEVYNEIFPLNPGQVRFTNASFVLSQQEALLDIGCGTGLLSQALSATFKEVVGIDLDEAMLAQARAMADPTDRVSYLHLNMLDINKHFNPESFDGLVCFGNTLVHLPSLSHISEFFKKAYGLLNSKGKLLMQIINYDRILDQNIKSLPTLENDQMQFIRNYHYLEDQHLIEFETILTIKKSKQMLRNKIHLLPVRQTEIDIRLKDAGFKRVKYYGNFNEDPFSAQSIPLVIKAAKV